VFLLSGYKARWVLHVSRYKVSGEQRRSHGMQSFIKSSGGWRHYVAAKRRLVAPGFVMVQNPVNRAGAKAKTMTSLLIIPSVLGFRDFIFFGS